MGVVTTARILALVVGVAAPAFSQAEPVVGFSPAPAAAPAAAPNTAPTVQQTVQMEAAPTVQYEPQRFIQRAAPAAIPVGQMPMILSYEVPQLRLRAKYQLIQPGGGKKGRKGRYQLPALSVPSYSSPAPMLVVPAGK